MNADNKIRMDAGLKPNISNVELSIEDQIRDNEKLLKPVRRNISHHRCRLCDSSESVSDTGKGNISSSEEMVRHERHDS